MTLCFESQFGFQFRSRRPAQPAYQPKIQKWANLTNFHSIELKLGTDVSRVQECVLFIKFNVKTPIPYPFYVRRTMKVVSRPWNMRVGSHRGPERAFWAFFHHFWQFLTVFGLIIRFERIFLGLNSLCVCTYVLHRQILQYLKKNHSEGPYRGPEWAFWAVFGHFWQFLG